MDIGKDYSWKDGSNNIFIRKFGNTGYDYGWSGANSIYDDGIIVTGSIEKKINTDKDLWVIKTDKDGLLIWDKAFGGKQNDEGYDVVSTSDGGYIFAGYTWSFGKSQQIYIVKTDLYGNLLWEKNYGGSMWDVGTSIIELNNGGYAITGFSNSPGISSGNTDIILLIIDDNGNELSLNAYGNKEFPNHEWGYDIIQLYDDSFIIVGARDRYSNGMKNNIIYRISIKGNILWEKEILDENNINEIAYSVSANRYGSIYVCSGENDKNEIGTYKPKIIKIDAAGNIEWQRTFNSNSKEHHQFRAIALNNNDLLLTGSSIIQMPNKIQSDAFLTRVDSNGNIIWSNAYGTADEDDWGWFVFEKNNNKIIMIGSTKSYEASLFDVLLIGVDSEGSYNQ